MSIQPTQPQSIGGVLDTTFQLYKASLVSMLPLSVLVILANSPQYIFMIARGSFTNPNPATLATPSYLAGYGLSALVGWIAITWMTAAATVKSASIAAGSEVSVSSAVLRALARLHWLIIALLLYLVVIGILAGVAAVPFFAMGGLTLSSFAASCVLAIPCLIFAISLFLFTPICLFDKRGPIGALTGSHRLVWGNWWRTLAILTVGVFIIFVFYVVIGLMISAVLPFVMLSGPENMALVGLLTGLLVVTLVSLLMTPFYTAMFLSLYWDLKLRKEGGDLAARVGALDPA